MVEKRIDKVNESVIMAPTITYGAYSWGSERKTRTNCMYSGNEEVAMDYGKD